MPPSTRMVSEKHSKTTFETTVEEGKPPLHHGIVNSKNNAKESNCRVERPLHNSSLKRRRSLPTMTHNRSSPSTPGNQHFLQGIVLDECKDLLSIPDPPTPPVKSSRRVSSGSFVVPLRDLSNGDKQPSFRDASSSTAATSNTKRNVLVAPLPDRKTKRSRLSLPSMASPIVSKKSIAASATKFRSENTNNKASQTPTSESLHASRGNIHNGDSEDLGSAQEPTKKMNGCTSTSFQTFKAPERSTSDKPDVYRIPTKPDTKGLMEIRELVHAYTLLPQERRFDSKEAKAIERVTGYPVVSAFVPKGAVSQASRQARRKHIIDNLSSRMKNVDSCKNRDARLTQTVTQCRVQKFRGGHMVYTHIPSGRHVEAEEFEARYMCMIEEVSAVRSQSWGNYFAKLSQDLKEKTKTAAPLKQDEDTQSKEDASSSTDSSPPSDSNSNTKASPEETFPDATPPNEIQSDIEMEVIDQGTDHEVHKEEDLCSDIIYKTIDPTTKPQVDDDDDEPLITPAKKLPRPPSPTSPDMLLPFPSRDQPSSNALIARAERKLWNAIDDALATYSKEVLEIQAGRKC